MVVLEIVSIVVKVDRCGDHHRLALFSNVQPVTFASPENTTMETRDDQGLSAPSVPSTILCCQADNCTADLTDAKKYHRRHKVCEFHAKAPVVIVSGLQQRFCQQCSKFHEIPEFDDMKRSCRRRLAGHNERRRRSTGESSTRESSSRGS
ncbi:hypothetical protein Drorol1_Dr00020916 [Drosera rotundifolia]